MDIKKVGVVGIGTMGGGIVYCSAQTGYEVIALDISDEAINSGIEKLQAFADKSIAKGKLTSDEKQTIFDRIKTTTEYSDFKDCDIVVEAVAENYDVKEAVFKAIEKVVSKNTIIASNTSSLSINEIAGKTDNPERVVGLHFFNPPQLMKLVELIRNDKTSDENASAAKVYAESLGKTVITCKDNPGFIVNYLQYPFRLNAIRMVQDGIATPEEIDIAAKLALGHKMGPLELQDMVGLDITYNGANEVYEKTGNPAFKPPELMKEMIERNELGRKTGKGFYTYDK